MPASDTVWPVPLPELVALLARNGLDVETVEDWTAAHGRTAAALVDAFEAPRAAIAPVLGHRALDELLAAHRLWVAWLGSGRVRKLGIVAVR